jgi:hypothetical protein
LSEQLAQLEVRPADLLDIHDFVRATTTPSAKKRMEALRQSTEAHAAKPDGKGSPDDPSSDQEAA